MRALVTGRDGHLFGRRISGPVGSRRRDRPAGQRHTTSAPRLIDQRRLPTLTGLRFVAAAIVFGFHVRAQGVLGDNTAAHVVDRIFAGGATGVGFFFILSGFVLTWSAQEADTPRDIWRRRAARVFPNHVIAWIIAFGGIVAAGTALSLGSMLPSLFLVQAWFPTSSVFFAVNTPSWSLSCELAFYFAFPFLLPIVQRFPSRHLWGIAGLVVSGVFVVPLAAMAIPPSIAYWFVWVFPATRALDFVLGMVLARIVTDGRWIRIPLWAAGTLTIAGCAVAPLVPDRFGYVATTVIPFGLLIGAAAKADVDGRPTPWRGSRAVLLGELSFAFYLLHQIVIRAVDVVTGGRPWPVPDRFGLVAVMLVVTLAASWVLHKAVERPMVRLFGRPARRHAEPVESAARA